MYALYQLTGALLVSLVVLCLVILVSVAWAVDWTVGAAWRAFR